MKCIRTIALSFSLFLILISPLQKSSAQTLSPTTTAPSTLIASADESSAVPSTTSAPSSTSSDTSTTTTDSVDTSPSADPTATVNEDATSPAAIQWLNRIESVSRKIESLQADLRYDRIQDLLGDKQRYFGKLYYQAGPPAKFAAHFHRRLADGKADDQNRWFIFDGIWLVEKIADQHPRQFLKRQVVAPDTPPADADPLALGNGPFVLPIYMQTDRVLRRFTIKIIDPIASDPPDSLHLQFLPKSSTADSAGEIHLWYHRQSLLPLRAKNIDIESQAQSIVDLTNSQINASPAESVFDTAAPTDPGWDVIITPWENR